jgi:hypothetical protein
MEGTGFCLIGAWIPGIGRTKVLLEPLMAGTMGDDTSMGFYLRRSFVDTAR